MKNIFLLFLFLVSVAAFGQYGWTYAEVYLTDGSVLKGEAKITMHSSAGLLKPKFIVRRDKVVFRKEKGEERQRFKHYEIKEIKFNYNNFESRYVPVKIKKSSKHARFMKVIYEGEKASLYQRLTKYVVSSGGGYTTMGPGLSYYSSGSYSSGTEVEFWVDKPNDKQMYNLVNGAIRFKSYKNRLLEVFGDCASLVPKIEDKEFTKNPLDLTRLLEDYNDCTK